MTSHPDIAAPAALPTSDTARYFPAGDEDVAALRRRLARAAHDEGLVDVVYRYLDSPIGPLLLAGTDRGLVRVAFDLEGFEQVVTDLAAAISPRMIYDDGALAGEAAQLQEYFAGRRTHFEIRLDDRLSHGFRQSVQRALPSIGYGHTMTYKQVADLVGNPAAVRAVGSACARNPLPIVVPCHRVVRSDGALGGYLGGLEAKATLLELERAA